jgi:hypothetical protein
MSHPASTTPLPVTSTTGSGDEPGFIASIAADEAAATEGD